MRLRQKLIATILAVMMLTSYVAILTDAVIAVGVSLVEQNGKTNHANVELNSYFEGEEHSKTFETGKEAKLYLKFKVSNTGYLKNGVVQFSNANFEVNSNSLKNDKVQSSSKDKINLKQINNGEEVIVEVPLMMTTAEKIDKDFFSKVSTVKFTGTYMDENGKEKAIEKEIHNQLNWKGTAEAELAGEVSKYLPYNTEAEKGLLVQVKVKSNVKDNGLPVAKTRLEIEVPEMALTEGMAKPERITVVANTTEGTNGKGSYEFNGENYKYNSETNKVEIEVENKEEDGKIAWNKKVVDEYLVNFIYTGEEVYTKAQEQLEKASQTIKTEEEKKAGQTNENAISGEIAVKLNLEVFNSEETKIEESGKIHYSIEQAKGELVDTKLNTFKELSKGYIYANYAKPEKETKKGTNYTINHTVQIQDKTLIDSVEVQLGVEKYLDQEGNEYNSKIYSKKITISEAVFNKMLGEEGKVEVFNLAGEKLAEITNNLEKDNKGNYEVDITEAKVNEIIIKTTKPITEGNIEIAVEKEIAGKQAMAKEQMQEMASILLEATTRINTIVEEKQAVISNSKKETKLNLTEPVSKAEISIGTQNLSTIVENKDVELRVVLDTSSNKNALYKNPTFQIMLPENIEKLKIKSTDLLLDDELKIKETKVVEQNGRKVILVTLTGTQTKYMDNDNSNQDNVISKGANIVIKADITFKKLAPSANSNIYLYYTNENTDLFEKPYQNLRAQARNENNTTPMGIATTSVTIVAPNGVMTESHMDGYNKNENMSNTSNEKQVQKVDANTPAKEVTIGGTIVNNYENSIGNVLILGRIPFSGNKEIDKMAELGSNFTMPMKEKITTNGIDSSKIKIYYSTNGEATKDLIDSNNNWTEEPSNIAEVKSYLIVISGEVAKATQFSFDYKTELPANLSHNKEAYTGYKVYFNNNMEDATLGETKVAGVIGLTTGQGPELQVSVKAATDTVKEGQIVKMTATVKNTGSVTAQNAKLLIKAPDDTVHAEYNPGVDFYQYSKEPEKEISLGDIKAGETITKEYELKIEKLDGYKYKTEIDENGKEITVVESRIFPGEKEVQNVVRVSAENMSGEIASQSATFKIQEGDISIISSNNCVNRPIQQNNKVKCVIHVENISNTKVLNNVTVKVPIPSNMKVEKAYYTYSAIPPEEKKENISITSDYITINLGALKNPYDINIGQELYESANIVVEFISQGFSEKLDYVVTAKADETEEYQSNSNTITGTVAKLQITAKPLEDMYIPENSEFTYQFVVENIGEVATVQNKIEAMIPEGTNFIKATYTYQGKTQTQTIGNKEKVTLSIYSIEPGEKVEISVTVKANPIKDEKDKEISIWANLEALGIEKMQSNTIKAIIEYDESAHDKGSSWNQDKDNDKPVTGSRYKIAGTAWIDENKDGQREETEQLLEGVQVILLYKSNSQMVKDETTGANKMTITDSEGRYEFSNLKPDEYLVLFLYDAGKYSITNYQQEGVSETVNSDAVNMKIILNGEQRQAGVSNTIKIVNSHARNIDIGLFVAEKFDLRLDKYISKVTLKTPSGGTKTYHYNNAKLTKREIASKDIGNSQLVIEYKIVATNEGQVDGYVKKIIDYLPDDAKFSSELNKDWYSSDKSGAVYNTALANEKIQPGQSKEVRLVLSFNITNKNIGKMINNNAEIYESYNELGLEDIDSIVANRLESEDDMSSADIITSVATGRIILYTTFALGIAILMGMGIYEIKKRVLIKKDM